MKRDDCTVYSTPSLDQGRENEGRGGRDRDRRRGREREIGIT